MKIYDLPLHKDTYFFGYGIDIEKPIEMANQIIKLQQENQKLKEQLQQKEDIINKAKEYIKPKLNMKNKDGVSFLLFKRSHVEKILEILDNKGE